MKLRGELESASVDEADAVSDETLGAGGLPHRPHSGTLQFGVAGILTADFDEAAQCGQHFIPGWGP